LGALRGGWSSAYDIIVLISVHAVILACFSVLKPLLSGCDPDADVRRYSSRPAAAFNHVINQAPPPAEIRT
jgi:hypothetical protein